MSEPKRSPAQISVVRAVDHCLQLIEALARNEGSRGVTELGAELGLAKSTIYKLLQTLLRRGYAVQDPASGRYRLGLKFLELGGVVQGSLSIRTIAHPYLQALMEATNETVQLGVLEGHEVVYADKIECARTIRMYSRVGRRSPLHCTALGKVLLADQPEAMLREILDSRLERHAPRTITTSRALRAELQEVREKGYAFDDEEFEEGLRCLAAPARDYTGAVVASLGIAGPAARFEPARRSELIKRLRDTAEAVSRDLGYKEVNPPMGGRGSGAERESAEGRKRAPGLAMTARQCDCSVPGQSGASRNAQHGVRAVDRGAGACGNDTTPGSVGRNPGAASPRQHVVPLNNHATEGKR